MDLMIKIVGNNTSVYVYLGPSQELKFFSLGTYLPTHLGEKLKGK